MDSVRSECSDSSSSLGSGRFGGPGGGPGSNGASFSFSSAGDSSSTSRLSTTRSDFLSNYEHKFLARKAEKKKKREREQRLAAEGSNQLTADDRRRADRERERLARKAEMAAWLPSPAALQQRDRDRKKRSREAMRSVLRWYPPLSEHPEEAEAEDARVARATGTTPAALAEIRKRHAEIAPLFLPDSAHARDMRREQQQRALRDHVDSEAAALQRRVADLQLKMACVERLTAAAHSTSPRKRMLAPLTSTALASSQSAVTLPTEAASPSAARRRLRGSKRDAHTRSSGFLFRETPDEAAQARAYEAAELDAFLDSHKRQRRRVRAACKMQATWRMARKRRKFLAWRAGRTRAKHAVFQVWMLSHRIARQARRSLVRRCLRAWRSHVRGAVRLRALELRLFREAELAADVPKIVANLVFMADDEDDDAYTRKVLANALQPTGHDQRAAAAYRAGFVNAAFAPCESLAGVSSRLRVRAMRAQHLEARRAVAKKIGQRVFLLWKRVHAERKRVGLDAQLCLKRAARQAFQGKRPVWAGEKLLTVFELWARYAAFTRSKRLRVPLPHFPRALPLWDVWLHNYQERHVRKVKAAARAPLARMKRCFRGFRVFAAFARRKRLAWLRATRLFTETTTRAVLHAWRDAIAEQASHKKLLRAVLCGWRGYATRKRTMRPWKVQVHAMRLKREQQRAWGAWRHAQLRSCFTRELHRARLASQPAWRWKVQRLLLVWMDLREPLRKWKCFVAWRHAVQRRKLFLTARAHARALRRKHLLYGVFSAWKAVVWKQEDEFLEDRLQLSAWDAYKELSPLLPMLFYGCFSDAAAIFAGVPSALTEGATQNKNAITVNGAQTDADAAVNPDALLERRPREVRAFHDALLQGSVIEARNLILQQRHLVNAVDASTGNTALHVVAGQIEDDERRLEILSLLLSEGACTWDTPNKHGLTPVQLAPPEAPGNATRRLLARGVYAFHADGAVARAGQPTVEEDEKTRDALAESRLVWCLVARMSSEYVRGERVAGDLRREWFSELQDELWLRRGRVGFASSSPFAAAVRRCRAFLNGMTRRLCRAKADVLLDLWARVQKQQRQSPSPSRTGSAASSRRPTLVKSTTRRTLSRDLARMEEKVDLLAWLKNTPDDPTSPAAIQRAREQRAEDAAQARALAKAQSLGEYSAYAQALLWPVLHDEPAERALVPSFVGVLFSLAFPADAVLAEAMRLELECAQLERDVLEGFQAIMRAELRCRSPELPHGMPLLRYFTEQADAEFFFKRELLLLDTALYWRSLRRQQPAGEDDDGDDDDRRPPRGAAELQLEADVLVAKAQRKHRKVDKKAAAFELEVASLSDAHARVLLRQPLETSRARLGEICDARGRLEDARLRLANLKLKQLDWGDKAAELLALRRSLDANANANAAAAEPSTEEEEGESDATLRARRAFLEEQLQRYAQELKPPGSARAGVAALAQSPVTALRRLHKAASRALWTLFVKNLLRACCFWLAENLLRYEDERREAEQADEAGGEVYQDGEGQEDLALEEDAQADVEEVHEDEGHHSGSGSLVALRKKPPAPRARRVSVETIAEPVTAAVATTFAAARKASATAVAQAGGGSGSGRRRSSVQNTRASLDTIPRGAAAAELAETQTQVMRENYAGSSQLLFERDRDAMLEDERLAGQRELLDAQHQAQHAASAVAETNPITGLPETPSSRLLDADEVAEAVDALAHAAAAEKLVKRQVGQTRNRKRELLRRAMAQRQLQRLAAAAARPSSALALAVAEDKEEDDEDDDVSSGERRDGDTESVTEEDEEKKVSKKWAPLVDGVIACEDGESFGFGNFVLGLSAASSSLHSPHPPVLMANSPHKAVAAAMAESLWKRGGTARRPGETAAGGAASSSPASSSASAGLRSAVGGGFELFASAEDEQAFNAAFRVMSASKDRRATPDGRRLSSISAAAGAGLGAVSPRADPDAAAGVEEPPSGDAGEELTTLLAELHVDAAPTTESGSDLWETTVVEEASPQRGSERQDEEEEEEGEEEREARVAAAAARDDLLRVELASLVSATDETEFFDQTLQHYLARVRQDSFVAPRHLTTGDHDDGHSGDNLVSQDDDSCCDRYEDPTTARDDLATEAGGAGTALPYPLDGNIHGASSVESLRTPLIKWEATGDEHHPTQGISPALHVESTRLLVPSASATLPVSSIDAAALRETAVLLEALREIEHREHDEQRQRQLVGEPLLLSGKTSTMAVRRQKSSVASTLVKKDVSSKRKCSEAAAGIRTRIDQLLFAEETPVSPSVPKVMVAIQRKAKLADESTPDEAPSPTANVESEEKSSSPTRKLSQKEQQPSRPIAHCELRLERAKTFSKTTRPAVTSRRRTSQVDPQAQSASATVNLKRQASRLPAAPVEFCLEGASALTAPSMSADPSTDPEARSSAEHAVVLPDLSEEQKRNIWRQFTAVPLSDAMQDAYAQLYPHLYEPVTPLPSAPTAPALENHRRPSLAESDTPTAISNDAVSAHEGMPAAQQITLDKRFWSAVEGFKAVGGGGGSGGALALVPLDEKTAQQRRVESAVAIYQQFLGPAAPSRLPWVSMYSDELRAVERRLLAAPLALFDALQLTAQLHISTLQAQQRQSGYTLCK